MLRVLDWCGESSTQTGSRRDGGRWKTWYETAVPLAEHLHERHMDAIADEGLTDDES
jgi:hypothetical protein